MSEIRDAVLTAYRAALRRHHATSHFPVTASTVAGMLVDYGGNTMRAREMLDRVRAILDMIDGRTPRVMPGSAPLAKARTR